MDTTYHEIAFLGLQLAGYFGYELAVAHINVTRLQLASECAENSTRGRRQYPLSNKVTASEARSPWPPTRHFADFVQLSRAATPHTITGPKLPYGAPPGPVMYPSLANFKMRNSSVRRPR
jgi:hypothetical protein